MIWCCKSEGWCVGCGMLDRVLSSSDIDSVLVTKSSLRSIQIITSIICACHGALDINGSRIDHKLPADALPLRGSPMSPTFVIVRLRRKTTSSKAADRENIFPQGNLDVAIANVRHFNGKQETSFVFVNRDAVVAIAFLTKAVCRRHICRLVRRGHGFYRDGTSIANAHHGNQLQY